MKYPREVTQAALTLLEYAKNNWPSWDGKIPVELQVAAFEEKNKFTAANLMDIWNKHRISELPKCHSLTAKRERQCNARIREYPDMETWRKFVIAINNNDWASGRKPSVNSPHWRANFDWFIKPGNIVKYLEGVFTQSNPRPEKKETARDVYGDELDNRNEMYGGR